MMRAEPEESLVFVYDGASGLAAMALDVLKKLAGREECPLCEITYSPTGKRSTWRECERRLGMPVEEMHRDELPSSWGVSLEALPCVIVKRGGSQRIVLGREDIVRCGGRPDALERALRDAMQAGAS